MLSKCGDDRPRRTRASGSSTSPSSPSRTTTPAHAGIGQVMSDVQFQSFLNSSFTTLLSFYETAADDLSAFVVSTEED